MKAVPGPLVLEDGFEGRSSFLRGEEGASLVTGEGDEVVMACGLVAFQVARHGEQSLA
jgi:hypothetical protein